MKKNTARTKATVLNLGVCGMREGINMTSG